MNKKQEPKSENLQDTDDAARLGPDNLQTDFYSRLFAQANAAIIGFDRHCRIVNFNAAAERAFSQNAEQALGHDISQVLPREITEEVAQSCRRAIESGTKDELHLRLDKGPHEPVELSVQVNPLRDEKGQVNAGVVWAEDVTQLRKLERDLASSERLASLGTLAGGVAHHFNNILGGVSTFVDYALQTDDPRASRRALQMTAQAAERAASITKSLLAFARKDSTTEDLADLTEVVLTFASLVERTLVEKHIELDLQLHPVPVLPVRVDRMHTVLGNLLDNAEEAMPQGGKIEIELDEDHGSTLLEFRDNGTGINSQSASHIFEPFYTTKADSNGGQPPKAGLGLAVVHGLVAEMGASIDVKSTPGQGSSFRIRFFRPKDAEKS